MLPVPLNKTKALIFYAHDFLRPAIVSSLQCTAGHVGLFSGVALAPETRCTFETVFWETVVRTRALVHVASLVLKHFAWELAA